MFSSLTVHYNYYIVIVLMMVGLYAIFASGNMIKRLVGLSVFQTSVFLFYITIGKVLGGDPPILPEKDKSKDKTDYASDVVAAPSAAEQPLALEGQGGAGAPSLRDEQVAPAGEDLAPTTMQSASADASAGNVAGFTQDAAAYGDEKAGKFLDAGEALAAHNAAETPLATVDPGVVAATFPASALDATYSNPLPHVLILTAIVVGVATLAVGLALVVRVREAFGTIEDDDLNLAEHEADLVEAGR